jgi:hypothetical protein
MFREPARIGDHDVIVIPTGYARHPGGCNPDGRGHWQPPRGRRAPGNPVPYSEHTDEQFLLPVTGTEAGEDLIHYPQERPTEELIHLHPGSSQDLKDNLVGREEASFGFGSP